MLFHLEKNKQNKTWIPPTFCKLGCHRFLGILLKNNTIKMPKARKKIIKREPRPELKQFLENCASQLGLTFFTLLSLNAKIRRQCIKPSNHNCAATVWPQPIWKKVRSWWQIPPQHQSTYLGGPESASIEIPPFRPFLWSRFLKIKIFKIFRNDPNFFLLY